MECYADNSHKCRIHATPSRLQNAVKVTTLHCPCIVKQQRDTLNNTSTAIVTHRWTRHPAVVNPGLFLLTDAPCDASQRKLSSLSNWQHFALGLLLLTDAPCCVMPSGKWFVLSSWQHFAVLPELLYLLPLPLHGLQHLRN